MKRNLRMNVHINFRHFILYSVVEGVFWFFACLSYLAVLNLYNVEIAHVVACVPSIFFMFKNLSVLLKNRWFSIYENGIDFKGLGFWEWEDVKYSRKLFTHEFVIKIGDRCLTKEQIKLAKRRYLNKDKQDMLLFVFEYPPFSMNKPGKEVYELIRKLKKIYK